MELIFQWFWLLKFIAILFTGFAIYKVIKSGFKSKIWMIIAGVTLLFHLVSPIKLDVSTKTHTDRTNNYIQQNKQLPDRVEDNSFQRSKQFDTISEQDLWKN